MGCFGLVFLFDYYQNIILHKWLVIIFSLKIIIGSILILKYKEKKFFSSDIVSKIFISFFFISTLYIGRIYFATKAIGLELNIIQIIEFSSIMLLISIIPIVPGNLGIKELALGYISTRYGLSLEIGIIIGMIDRIALWSFIIPTAIILLF